jgi:hypothetical protein
MPTTEYLIVYWDDGDDEEWNTYPRIIETFDSLETAKAFLRDKVIEVENDTTLATADYYGSEDNIVRCDYRYRSIENRGIPDRIVNVFIRSGWHEREEHYLLVVKPCLYDELQLTDFDPLA